MQKKPRARISYTCVGAHPARTEAKNLFLKTWNEIEERKLSMNVVFHRLMKLQTQRTCFAYQLYTYILNKVVT